MDPDPRGSQRAERHDEWDRVQRVPVAVLEPAATVVEEAGDQHEQRGACQQPRPRERQSARTATSSPGEVNRIDIP